MASQWNPPFGTFNCKSVSRDISLSESTYSKSIHLSIWVRKSTKPKPKTLSMHQPQARQTETDLWMISVWNSVQWHMVTYQRETERREHGVLIAAGSRVLIGEHMLWWRRENAEIPDPKKWSKTAKKPLSAFLLYLRDNIRLKMQWKTEVDERMLKFTCAKKSSRIKKLMKQQVVLVLR